jgi:GntR family transcriptional regulator
MTIDSQAARIAGPRFLSMLLLTIDSHSPKPVYQQVIDQVKYAVARGSLRPGDRLDSIRDVAIQTRVNRNTIARAYMELEREGVIRSRAGQGSFISDDTGASVGKAQARKILAEKIDEVVTQARLFGLDKNEVMELTRQRLNKLG